MVPTRYLLALCALVVLAGCAGGPGGGSTTPTPTATDSPTPTATSTAPATSTLSLPAVGERVVHAEQTRVRERAEEYESLADLSFGILEPAEYEIDRRNGTGVFVAVTVGYSTTLDCEGEDGGPSVDGATTEATYFATEDDLHLVNVSQDVVDLGSYC